MRGLETRLYGPETRTLSSVSGVGEGANSGATPFCSETSACCGLLREISMGLLIFGVADYIHCNEPQRIWRRAQERDEGQILGHQNKNEELCFQNGREKYEKGKAFASSRAFKRVWSRDLVYQTKTHIYKNKNKKSYYYVLHKKIKALHTDYLKKNIKIKL